MEFVIKVATLDVKVSVGTNDYSERELSLIEVLSLNIFSSVNSQITGENMAFNPLEKEEKDIFHFQLAWQNSLTEAQYLECKEVFERRLVMALKMSGINDAAISFEPNAYQIN